MNRTKAVVIMTALIMLMINSPVVTAVELSQTPPDRPEPGVPFDIEPGVPVAVTPGESVELVTPNGISINVVPGDSVEITITESSTNPTGNNPTGGTALNIFVDIETNESTTVDATIEIPYGDQEDEVDNPENLQLSFYNESSEQWENVESTVDENAQVVSANVDHFSTWTVVETSDDGLLSYPIFLSLSFLLAIPVVRKLRK